MSKTVYIEGMTCGHCIIAVERALREIGLTAKADLKNKLAVVTSGDASDEVIREAVADAGYEVLRIVGT
jgi:copper chaperone CopZ